MFEIYMYVGALLKMGFKLKTTFELRTRVVSSFIYCNHIRKILAIDYHKNSFASTNRHRRRFYKAINLFIYAVD